MNAQLRWALATALFIVCGTSIPFAQTDAQSGSTADDATGDDSEVLKAIERDLGLSPEQARERIIAENRATKLEPVLQAELGNTWAGAWFDPADLKLVVATTDPEKADIIMINGAKPAVVDRNMDQLNTILQELDQAQSALTDEQKQYIWEWYVDVVSNTAVVTIPADNPSALQAAQDLVAASGADPSAIRIEQSVQGPPTLLSNIARGGDEYMFDSGFCTIGFSVQGGYVTAGHCSDGTTGMRVEGYNGVDQGSFAGSVFPVDDRAWVRVNSNWTPVPCVGNVDNRDCSASNNVQVLGSQEAPVGSSVCRWGWATGGPHCGVIKAKNETVCGQSVPLGIISDLIVIENTGDSVDTVLSKKCPNKVKGLTKTSVCASFGDSGGPYMHITNTAGNQGQGQGTLSGAILADNSNCEPSGSGVSSGTSWFFPLNRSLSGFNLTLLTPQTAQPSPVAISSFTADPSNFEAGGSTFLSWTTSNATSCTGSGNLPGWTGAKWFNGGQTLTVSTAGDYTATLSCSDAQGMQAARMVNVTVTSPPPPPVAINSFTANPSSFEAGGSTMLSWTTSNATSCAASGNLPGWTGAKAVNGSQTLTVSTAGSYTATLSCSDAQGMQAARSVNVTVTQPQADCPASSGTQQGTASTVTWDLVAAAGGSSWQVNGDGTTGSLFYNGQFGTANVRGGCLNGERPVANWLKGSCSGSWSVTASVSCQSGIQP